MPRVPKPEPVVVSTICSECGLPWEDHGEAPTLADCVRLLKARPTTIQTYPYTPAWPSWTPTITWGDNTTAGNVTYLNLTSDGTRFTDGEEDPPDDAVPAAV